MNAPVREHILLTILGVRPQPATYVLGEKTERSRVAPAALYRLLPEAERPDRILALCTPEAATESLPSLSEGIGASCPIEAVVISFEPTDEAVHAFLAKLTEHVPPGAELTVDVTHGLRHLSFVAYAGVLYLTAVRGVRLRAAYYAMWHGDQLSPFIDVRPLIELPRWFHAVRVLSDTGSAQAMADLVAAADGDAAGRVGGALRTLSEAYVSALPIELGYLSRRFLTEQVEPLREVLDAQRLPLAGELVRDLTGVLAQQQLAQELPERDWKPGVRLDRAELARQVGIIDRFLARCDYPTAFGLMREWLVLWAMWRTGVAHRWLDYRARRATEGLLHELKGAHLTAEQAAIGQVWSRLTRMRNAYAHHGFDTGVTLSTEDGVRDQVEVVVRVWRDTLRAVPELSLGLPAPPPPDARLLVSPVGTRPGVLFSALRAADPHRVSRCLVVCSAETEAGARQACEAAGYSGELTFVRLDDPFAGVKELGQRLGEAGRHLREAGEVLVNVTGGTTLMGVLVDRIAGKARRLKRPVYRFALVDRRPPAVQEADPYHAGTVCWLDDPPGRDERDDD